MKQIFILLALTSCANKQFQKKEKSLVGAAVAAGVLLKTAGCYAKLETKNMKLTFGTGNESEKIKEEKTEDKKQETKKRTEIKGKKGK